MSLRVQHRQEEYELNKPKSLQSIMEEQVVKMQNSMVMSQTTNPKESAVCAFPPHIAFQQVKVNEICRCPHSNAACYSVMSYIVNVEVCLLTITGCCMLESLSILLNITCLFQIY